jgi:GT2 family glycosyltransferase
MTALSQYKLGVVTVTFNAAELLADFFSSIKNQSFKNTTVYVIDNASSDGTAELVQQAYSSDCKLVINKINVGVAEGNNQGIKMALNDQCSHVLFLNNDTKFDASLFDKLLTAVSQSGCEITVPKIPFFSDPTKLWFAGGSFDPFIGFSGKNYAYGATDNGQFDQAKQITFAPTCCMLVSARVFTDVGLMDPAYFVYFDDNDFCLRAVRSGIRIRYEPSATLLHKVGQSTAGDHSPFSIRFMTRNRVYFARKFFTHPIRLIYLFMIFSSVVVRGLQQKNLRARIRAFREGTKMNINGGFRGIV